MRPQRLLGLVIILASLILYGGSEIWLGTRTFVAYDQSTSTWPGHISTGDFKINYSSDYWPQIVTRLPVPYDRACNAWDVGRASKWTLYEDGRPITPIVTPWYVRFDAGHHTYRVDVDVPAEASCLAKYQPRLVVSTESHEPRLFQLYLTWVLLFAGVGGVVVVVRSNPRVDTPPIPTLSVTDSSSFAASTLPGLKRSRFPSRRFKTIPTFGLVGSMAILCVSTSWWFTQGAFRYVSRGIRVDIVRPKRVTTVVEPDFIVRVSWDKKSVSYQVGNDVVAMADLPGRLKRELSVRADRTVYVDASDNLTFQSVVDVIDIVRKVQGRVVLLPRRAKDEVEESLPAHSKK